MKANEVTNPLESKLEAKAQYWRDQTMLARAARDAANASNDALRAALRRICDGTVMTPGKPYRGVDVMLAYQDIARMALEAQS